MTAFYNEHDPKAAAWLRELINQGHIAPGVVDERSIEDITPDELAGFTQCHFFAGIGVWSYALRRAGWPDDRPVWTGSCPCQPFSAAGQQKGIKDERHLWPAWFRLIKARRPPVIFGEQVSSAEVVGSSLEAAFVVAVRQGDFARANKLAKQLVRSKSFHYWRRWLDIVCGEMEGVGYAVRPEVLGAHSVGAPHIRQRLYFVADATKLGWVGRRAGQASDEPGTVERFDGLRDACGLADAESLGRIGRPHGGDAGRRERAPGLEGAAGGVADSDGWHACAERQQRSGEQRQQPQDGGSGGVGHSGCERCAWQQVCVCERGPQSTVSQIARASGDCRPGPVNGFWRAADWLHCTDGRWRPVEAQPQQMVDGSAEVLGRVRDHCIAEFQEEIDAASVEGQIERTTLLRALREYLGAQARSVWQDGRVPGLHEAPFLLALLRQFETQGWKVAEGVPLSCAEIAIARLRSVRNGETASSPSHQRGLDGQQRAELTDAVHLLSSLLARHAHTSWADAYAAYAEIGFPLGRNSPARVGRLRGYGNAIVAATAQGFIESYLEVRAAG